MTLLTRTPRPPTLVPLKVEFSQERDVEPVYLGPLLPDDMKTGPWRADVHLRLVDPASKTLIELDVESDGSNESRLKPLALTEGDRVLLRAQRAAIDGLLGTDAREFAEHVMATLHRLAHERQSRGHTVDGEDLRSALAFHDPGDLNEALEHLEAAGRIRGWGGGHVYYYDILERT